MSDNFNVEEVEQPKRQVVKKKWHVETTDAEVKELNEKYAVIQADSNRAIENLDPVDVETMFEKYGTRIDVDLYTIAETLHVSDTTLAKLCKSDRYKEIYQSAKLKRGEMLAVEGYHVASEPYNRCIAGEDINPVFVNACKLKANYNLAMAKAMNPEYGGGSSNGNGSGISLTINTGINLD